MSIAMWMVAMFVLGLAALGVCLLLFKACEKI
jgi:hypothetical protein